MTQQVTEAEVPVRDQTVVVQVPKDSRLETLLCIWEVTHDKLTAARAADDDVKAGILAELTALYPEANIKTYDIPGSVMWPPLNYSYQETPYLPAPKIREHLPPVYEAFKQLKKYWTLTAKKGKR